MSRAISTISLTESDAIAYLQSPQAIRDRCGQLFDLACQDQLQHFRCDLGQLAPTAAYVLDVMRGAYPDLVVPFHSRWRHFEVGGRSRLVDLRERLAPLTPLERARSQLDLAIVSVLLDAGAGAQWRYIEPGTDQAWQRSEGLAIASFHTFIQGGFSSDRPFPLQADAAGLQALTPERLGAAFQVSDRNPLVGLEGRVQLLQRLGQTMTQHPYWAGLDHPRPGHLVDHLIAQATDHQLPAPAVLQAVLQGFGAIWPGRVAIASVNLGDVWPHPALNNEGIGSTLVPFHKLSQWLTYSLLEPLQELGLTITHLDQMTGLAEYRNGGLCLDLGLLQPKHADVKGRAHAPGSEIIVEWRALTVILLDHLAAAIRQSLGVDGQALPLVSVLEGGTWAAGRRIARELRGGLPPIAIESDGTVF